MSEENHIYISAQRYVQHLPPPTQTLPGLTIVGTGKIVDDQFNKNGLRILNYYAMVYIAQGEGEYYSPAYSDAVPLKEGDLLLLFPGEPHCYGPINGLWTQYWVVFNGEIAETLEGKGLLSRKSSILKHTGLWNIQSSFNELLQLSSRKPLDYHIQMSALMYKILLMITCGSSYEEQASDAHEQLVEQIKIKLQENLLTQCSIEEIVTIGGYSYNYLRGIFKKLTSYSPLQYLIQLKILGACEQLSYSSRSIKEIAYTTGFDDPQYFSRIFRKVTGITPGKYRRMMYLYVKES